FPYVNVEKIEGQEKIERIVYPFLFRVTGKDILPDQKVYLLGTQHDFKVTDYPPEALALINGCDLLLSEFKVPNDSSKSRKEWLVQKEINTQLHIHKKLLSVDQEWIEMFLSAWETTTEQGMDWDGLISDLKEKSGEIQADQACWLDRLSLADQTKIQTRLDECGLQLKDLDPLSVTFCLHTINGAHVFDVSDQGEDSIINNFLKRNCPIIELEDKLSGSVSFFDERMDEFLDYNLESSLENILLALEPRTKKIDEVQQQLQEIQEKVDDEHFPLVECDDNEKCVEFKTSEAYRNHISLLLEAHKLSLLRSTLDDKIYYNFEEYEENWQKINPLVTDWTTLYRNNTWYPKIPLAIQQKKNTALICGDLHLIGETGMIRTLRRDGYDVSHIKAL
ncbi:MAG TPA: TraB/GumN family protein, partial [Rhabdochlamydiaceae bacterium]|nr:TraB/GumN family protein [Rhabdochlamydiaceae bacterium]